MELEKINSSHTISPGEYLWHNPTKQIVLCGLYKPEDDKIKFLVGGRLMEDSVGNFRKIKLSTKESKVSKLKVRQSCGGCKR